MMNDVSRQLTISTVQFIDVRHIVAWSKWIQFSMYDETLVENAYVIEYIKT